MTRRLFLGGLAATPALLAADAPAPKLGFDTYSLRAFKMKAPQLLEYATGQKLDAVQFSSLSDFASLEPAYLTQTRDEAKRRGIAVDAGIGCICPTSKSWNNRNGTPQQYLELGLRVAKTLNAPVLRCYLGASNDRLGPVPLEKHIEETVKALRSVRSQAMDANVKVAVENHSGDLQARELRQLIEEAGKEYVGACLDTANTMWVVEDPMVTLEVLAPYVVTTHVRDSVVYEHPRGAAAQWTALGEGSLPMDTFMARYRQLCPQSIVHLEVITGRPPRVLPYLEADFWKAFPKSDAAEFARFVALAKKGHPFNGTMVIADAPGPMPPEFTNALQAQQRRDLDRSLEYARKSLDLGVRWRQAA